MKVSVSELAIEPVSLRLRETLAEHRGMAAGGAGVVGSHRKAVR